MIKEIIIKICSEKAKRIEDIGPDAVSLAFAVPTEMLRLAAIYSAKTVDCPSCNAAPGKDCKFGKKTRSDLVHKDRVAQ